MDPVGSEQTDGRWERTDTSKHVNCAVPVLDGEIEVCSGTNREKWSRVRARVSMRLLPTPRVLVEVFGRPTPLAGNLYNSDRISTIRIPGGAAIQVRTLEVHIGKGDFSLATPIRQPVTSVRTGAKLASVRFDLLNFPSLSRPDRPAVLREGPWRIEIKPQKNLAEKRGALKTESGYALTHEGTMTRSDGMLFSVDEAEAILKTLYQFLSFARGGSCGLALVAGKDENGDGAWEQWGSYWSYPWFSLPSWLDHRRNNEEELAQVFAGFMKMMKPKKYSYEEPISAALFWYLRSNESNNPYAGIILTQAALERLSRDTLSDSEWASHETKGRIGETLKKACIDPAVPLSCKELSILKDTDGASVVVRTRNNLVHSKVSESLSLDALLEIQHLGQWYVELLLLWKCGYRGCYVDRLRDVLDGECELELVPWAE